MKTSTPLLIAALLCGLCGSAMAAVTASLDRDQVADGDTVQLTLQHDGQGGGQPDLGPLKKDFDVLSSSTSSNIEVVNGHFSSQRQVQLTLAPKHSGTLLIPPLSWDGEQSKALSLSVSGSGGSAAGNSAAGNGASSQSAPAFLTSTLDQNQPYVQSSVVLTVQLHVAQPLYQANLDFVGNSDVVVEQLGKDVQSSETRNGRRYDVIERKYLLQPQRSGRLRLDGPTLDAQIAVANGGMSDPFGPNSPFGRAPFSGMFNTAKPVRLHGEPIELDVRPRPAAAAGRDWLPATQLSLEEAWKPDGSEVHVGDPVTLHLRLRAIGQTGAQLPDLGSELGLPDGLKAYPDQAKSGTDLEGGAVVGTREQDIAIIAERPGRYEVSAIRLHWWDTQKDAQRELTLAPHSLEVLPAAGAAAPPATPLATPPPGLAAPEPATNAGQHTGRLDQPTPTAQPVTTTRSVWFWISLVLGLLWIATLFAWWRKKSAASPPSPVAGPGAPSSTVLEARAARRDFQQACRNHAPLEARKNLIRWARAVWPAQPPTGLHALSRRVDPATAQLLRELDRACFAGGEWNGETLMHNLKSLEAEHGHRSVKPALPDLYS